MNRRHFTGLLSAGLLPHPPAASAQETARDGGASFFLIGDTHYLADAKEPGKMDTVSASMNAALIDTLNRLPGSAFPDKAGGGTVPEPHGVLHAGDLIDSGDKTGGKFPAMVKTELAAFTKDWGLNGGDGRLRWPVREVHGNHDSPRGDGAAVKLIKERNLTRKGLAGRSPNGLHYSWDWGGVHFVALGIVVGPDDASRRYPAGGSLAFLIDDLKKHVGTSKRPVVLMHHVDMARYAVPPAEPNPNKPRPAPGAPRQPLGPEWDHRDVQAYYEAIRRYPIAAILYGHTHARNLYRWNGTKDLKATDGILTLNTDNAAHYKWQEQAFLHIETGPQGTAVREFSTRDGWRTGAWAPQVWRFPAV